MSAHELSLGASNEWYTPPEVFDALGVVFDLDVASPGQDVVPWVPARACLTPDEDGLTAPWQGRVWMNPPFGGRNGYLPWAKRFIAHGNGIALAPNRTGAVWMQFLLQQCETAFFWSPKIQFLRPDGTRGKSPGYGTVLLAIGAANNSALHHLHGRHGATAILERGAL